MSRAKIAVFVSGGGTNLQALIDARKSGALHSGEIALVLSSSPNAYALERAAKAGIPSVVCSRKALGSQEAFEAAISQALADHGIQIIVLAGFMSILSEDFTRRWPRRILNVHPSLIPSFCGKGMYGLKVHEAALAKGSRSPAPLSTLSTRSLTAARSSCKGRWTFSPATPLRSYKGA